MMFGRLSGARTPQVELHYNTPKLGADWPFVTAGELGFHPLAQLRRDKLPGVDAFCKATRPATTGMYIGFFEDARRRVALVQDHRGNGDAPNFYEANAARERGAWWDYFYAAGYALFAGIEDDWHATDVVLAHPTGHGWGPPQAPDLVDMPDAFFDGLGNLLDDRALSLERIHVHSCCLDSPKRIASAARRLASSAPRAHVRLRLVENAGFELELGPEGRILRVVLAGQG